LDRELRGWLDLTQKEGRANLAKAILALANHGGGFVLIGFIREEGSWVPAEPRPSDLNHYTQDIVNDIVNAYAEPPFQCNIRHVPHSQSGLLFPIVVVPGGHKVPIHAKRSGPYGRHVSKCTYYIRRPGPRSEPPQSSREWDELIRRCVLASREDLLESIRDILSGTVTPPLITVEEEARSRLNDWIEEANARFQSLLAEKLPDEKPSRYSKGVWTVTYSIIGDFDPPKLRDFLDTLKRVQGHETGWPPWWVPAPTRIAPYPYNGLIECWIAERGRLDDVAHSDFWRASPQRMMFLLRGYDEDSKSELEPGKVLDLTLPIWRVGECLLHAERLANVLDQSASVLFRVTWEGLSGRTLRAWANPRRIILDRWHSRQDSVTSEVSVSVNRISSTLPEIIGNLTQPLYEAFDFFKPSPKMIEEELSEMRGRR